MRNRERFGISISGVLELGDLHERVVHDAVVHTAAKYDSEVGRRYGQLSRQLVLGKVGVHVASRAPRPNLRTFEAISGFRPSCWY
jgi:hypothetical protein